jgi:serine phosphatase RsbU (regulator of sigma subunit)
MTPLGHNFLNVTVNIQEVTDPEQIIYKLDQQVVDTLKQNDPNSIKDGMDIAVLSINQDKSLITFSGAGIPLYYISNGELEEFKGSNFGIGGVMRKEKQFVPYKIEYKPGDQFYIFSDGYADQIGGKEGRKYYKKKFKEFLMEIKDNPMDVQKKMIEDEFIQWKGDYKQIDDILVIGLRM